LDDDTTGVRRHLTRFAQPGMNARHRADPDMPGGLAIFCARRLCSWVIHFLVGPIQGTTVGAYLVPVLIAIGPIEVAFQRDWRHNPQQGAAVFVPLLTPVGGVGRFLALARVALKVGALLYGVGFVISPLIHGF
jgi:hypothetical protein